jgi:hypothetical protein
VEVQRQIQRGTSDGWRGFSEAVIEVDGSGKVAATYDLSSIPEARAAPVQFAVDSRGNVYFFTWDTLKETDAGPSVFVFENGGDFKEKVALSRVIRPRQMVVLGKSWFVGGRVEEAAETKGERRQRQVLYEFRTNGQFVREVSLTKGQEPLFAAAEGVDFLKTADLSQLATDGSAYLYWVTAEASPQVFKLDATGQVLTRRRLPEIPGTIVVATALDAEGHLVLDRSTVRSPGEQISQTSQVLTVLDLETLETMLEAVPSGTMGVLASARGNEVLFINRFGLNVELVRGLIQ